MRKHVTVLAIMLLVSACATGRATAPESDYQIVKQRADAWDRAIVAKDRPAVAANMSDDFVQIDSRGNISNKDAFLKGLLSPDLAINPYTVDEFQIRLYGNTAIVNGATDMTGTYKDKPFRTHYRFTDTYIKHQGVWRVVSVQTTEISE